MKPTLFAILCVLLPASALVPRQETNSTSGCVQAVCAYHTPYSLSSSLTCQKCSRLTRNSEYIAHFPGNGNFSVWDAKQQNVRSACRVEPRSPEDVSTILGVLVDTSCDFAVKSGGHAQNPDDSVSVGGVTIDLQRMRATEVFPDRTRVKLGAGHVLHSVYTDLEKYNLTTLGGRAASVGLGGYTLGGGLSHLSPMYGMAKDNVFEYELCYLTPI